IRHVVRIREGGIVRVSAWKEAGEHVVSIEDNGTGFDTGRIEKVSGRHIGIRNVRERIEKMCDGTFHIESREGTGTTVTIRIPEKVENL
ncbi:MAG: sensor histidine kinase, partial [Lachnospiraceae bacterium]|nr:sensor histidine kinase [Lachnospiraceae bacterium]